MCFQLLKNLFRSVLVVPLFLTPFSLGEEAQPLLDGKSLLGWSTTLETKPFWRVENGVLVGVTPEKAKTGYLWSEKSYEHFEFRCQFKLTGGTDSGIQFRSQNEDGLPQGYQADFGGPDLWGSIVEEGEKSRGHLTKTDLKKLGNFYKENDWNELIIRANGPRIQVSINGTETANFLETEPSVPYRGFLAIQLPKGGAKGSRIELKEMSLKKLDGGVDPADTKAWWAAKGRITYEELQVSKIPQTPEEELKSFTLPDGYVAELVAEESNGIGKFVAIDFDHQGRMWSMTALDYPVDAKKEKAKAENLFKNGGKDKILVFDTPFAAEVQTPRVFADGLAIPLGVMPYKNGAIAQYGADIRHYQDTDGDGKADKHEVLLTGFGIEDSHLFPHQFSRGPGGWMYLVQGLGNFSKVQRPDGSAFVDGTKVKPYDRCRVARMKLDGSDFQYTTTGPNNVWGMVTGRDGEWFIQEANDKGYPVASYDFGIYLNTGGTAKIKPYQPILPPVFETAIMGGTGLSGLALAEDRGSPFAMDEKKTFYVANPLTSSIQVVTGNPLGNNRYEWTKEEPFLVASDKWFRPVGIRFGPDGALYIVDWYNKIIAHGEVPQNHPDRDKVRGRIWRIRHKDQGSMAPPKVAEASDNQLLGLLHHNNALIVRQSWLEIIDRDAKGLIPSLLKMVLADGESLDRRLAALWALEGLSGIDTDLLSRLATADEANLRAEVVRIAGRMSNPTHFAAIGKAAADDPAVRVRSALGEALVSRQEPDAGAMHAAALLGKAALKKGDPLSMYEREFERFLARWAMENNPEATSQMLSEASGLSVENRLLAMQSLKPTEAALAFLPMIPKLDRELSTTELSLLTTQLAEPKVFAGFSKLLGDPANQKSMLEALSKADPGARNERLEGLLVKACRQLVQREKSSENLVIQVAQRHRLTALQKEIGSWILASSDLETISAGLRSLRELGPVDAALCLRLVGHSNGAIQEQALIALSTSPGADSVDALAKNWAILSATGKQSAVDGLLNSTDKAEAFGQAVLANEFSGLDSGSLEKIVIVLGDDPTAERLLQKLGDNVPMVIRLGAKGAQIDSNLNLKGAGTIEGWVRLVGKAPLNGILFTSDSATLAINNGKFSFSGKGRKDRNLLVSKSSLASGQWLHFALARKANGQSRLYLDGTEDAQSRKAFKGDLKNLDFGSASKPSQTVLELMELRFWNTSLDEKAIREGLQVSYSGGEKPTGLVHRFSGDSGRLLLKGTARKVPSGGAPALITIAKAKELAATFEKYQAIVQKPGNAETGKLMFQGACAACHMVKNVGGNLGPDLSGAGTMGDESLLRNILTPNAALESSYYRHDLKLKDGSLVSGFMASEDEKTITIRLIGADDRVISKSEIDTHSISKRSLMPEGLIHAFSEEQVADLFAYLRTLK